ncbi:MFS transporter [Umezawaea tangerina]|uniref:EmrB/QacA subfamily drug resistance transporter n=1 Tax=Umezawaea tangerina TaxID=84725 RepID=A0A2T0STU3_9PSEU|nr:MFS transporter [Umezawaea tangerina]PRY36820.1 EmrB/QacA subfamily drug resistance transporter [Umezawaea tangerina]
MVPLTDARRRWAFLTVIATTFMTYLDNNIVNVALPSMRRDLHLGVSGLEWVVSSYVLVFGCLLLVCGRLADLHGNRVLLLVGMGVFTLASLLAGLAWHPAVLIGGRAVQGLGAAAATPAALAVIQALYPVERQRNRAMGIWGAAGALALAVGPLLGGVLSEHVGWAWIFLINVPIGVAVLVAGAWSVGPPAADRVGARVDLAGLATSGGALFALTYALIQGGQAGWGSPVIVGCLVVAVLGGAAFVVVELRGTDPMVTPSWFRDPVFGGGMVAAFIWAFGIYGIYFFTSLYLQGVLGFSPTRTGLVFVPMALLVIIGSVLNDRAARRFGAHRSVACAMVVMAAGMAGGLLLGTDAGFAQVTAVLVVMGIGAGFTTSLPTTILGVMPAGRAGVASAIFSTVRQTGGLIGITAIGAVLAAGESRARRTGSTADGAFVEGFHLGLVMSAALVAVGGVVAYFALRRVAPTGSRPGRAVGASST